MASLATFGRLSGRLAGRRIAQDAVTRGFRTSASALAAQNFTMPALSPTMTEGNIATWRVKEGEKFSAGDVLLEIETDKATMDVEAQDEGVLMKIMKGDGSKSVPVGARIAVVAEEGDDVASLEIPADESAAKEPQEKSSSSSAPAPSRDPAPSQPEQEQKQPAAEGKSKKQGPKRTYPLLPSVAHLVKEKGLDESAVSKMTPTGPNGRLLKGDVLAYLGAIDQGTPASISARFEKLGHLDLSNIKVAAAKPAAPSKKAEASKSVAGKTPSLPQDALVAVPVSLAAALQFQKRVDKKLGVFLPLSTLVARAADLANDDLPAAPRAPTADELFDQVLGLGGAASSGSGASSSRGNYLPQISTVAPAAGLAPRASIRSDKPVDIIDLLAGSPRSSTTKTSSSTAALPGVSTTGINTFSLNVPRAEEKRARVFLERVKLVLENDPGRLVL